MKCKYFNDKYSSIDEFRATAEKVISIKICNRRKKIMTRNEYDIMECWDEENKEFDWDEYQKLCDIAEYWGCDE